jgi:hypothetical protein
MESRFATSPNEFLHKIRQKRTYPPSQLLTDIVAKVLWGDER